MRALITALTTLTVLLFATTVAAREAPGHLVLNGDIKGVVKTEDGMESFGGRMNGYLILSGGSFERGARVHALNVALFGVDQQLITGRPPRGKPTGVVGFSSTHKGEERQQLKYDPDSHSLIGRLKGQIDMPQIYEMTELKVDTESDLIELPTIPATLQVRIDLGDVRDLSKAREKPIETRMQAGMTLQIGESDLLDKKAPALEIKASYIGAQVALWPWIEVARHLCVQPVRILSFDGGFPFPFIHLSGDGLAFGRPGNNQQWAKADVVFTYRNWMTLFKSQFSTFSASEAGDLLSQVDVDDCIEVFFVDRFSPQTMWGGGATFGLGLASSKVISSDENADFGVDLTHLAHEMGHVLALPHPTSTNISSTNTLMCPSGFNNDNPARNSQENEQNLSNPLLTFSLKLLSPGPDCQNSSDCGACP